MAIDPNRTRMQLLVATTLCIVPEIVLAAPVSVDFTYHFRNFISTNNIGSTPGDFGTVGAGVRPNPDLGSAGTEVYATQNGTTIELIDLDSPAFETEFARNYDISSGLTGEWQITATNQTDTPDTEQAWTNSLINPTTGQPYPVIERVEDVRLSTDTGKTTPTLKWSLPEGFEDGTPRVVIHNRDIRLRAIPDQDGDGQPEYSGYAQSIHQQSLAPGATQYTIPSTLDKGTSLEEGTNYSINLRYELRRDSDGTIASNSNTFFDFQLVEEQENDVFIPVVDPNGSPTGGPVYEFDINLAGDEEIFIDPEVAVGYDYETGEGDPNFASVRLPDIGDGIFDLWLRDDEGLLFDTGEDLLSGEQFFFSELGTDYLSGVDFFRILGIEAFAGLDPEDPTAFVTGLTFEGSGNRQFTGTMTPITATVSAPALLPMMLVGLFTVGVAAVRFNRIS